MAGEDKLREDIREIVHDVVDPRFDNVDAQLKAILDRLPPALPASAARSAYSAVNSGNPTPFEAIVV